MNYLVALSERVKEKGLRLTRQRRIVYEELTKVDTHPRAEEVFHLVKKRLPKVSLGTVYRNLKALKEMGLVAEYKYAANFSRFDARMEMHHHFTCLKCGKVIDLLEPKELSLEQVLPKSAGFKLLYSRLEFYGDCPNCGKKSVF